MTHTGLINKAARRAFGLEVELMTRRARRAFGHLYDPEWLRSRSGAADAGDEDPLLRLGQHLRASLLERYRDAFASLDLRVAIHVPDGGAGLYSFTSWVQSLKHMGVDARAITDRDRRSDAFKEWQPHILIASDRDSILSGFDWGYLRELRAEKGLVVLLMVYYEEGDDSGTRARLDTALRECTADMYYFVATPEFNHELFPDYFAAGFEVISIPWSANPLIHYAVSGADEVDYFFVGGNVREKALRALGYLAPIVGTRRGIVLGAGFGPSVPKLDQVFSRYYYRICRVAPNFHEPLQMECPANVNERTLVIPACGGFELVDHPKALGHFFRPGEIAAVDGGPRDYYEQFRYYLRNPGLRRDLTARGMRRVYAEHTTFHRMEHLLNQVLAFRDQRR